jgi:spore coat polysaccharide biosynthesis protein SpsF
MVKIGIIIQARIGSSRLQNKVMIDIEGKPLLWHVVERCKKSNVDEIIIATSKNSENDVIEKFCKSNNFTCFRGSEEDVLNRYYEVAKKFNLDIIVRVTGDCPLVSPELINEIIMKFNKEKVDYMSNVVKRSFPRGLDVEIFLFSALEKANRKVKEKFQREHVTPFIYNNHELFRIAHLIAKGPLNRPDIRICVDTEEDLKLVKIIYAELYEGGVIPIKEVIKFLNKNPRLLNLNLKSEKEQRKKNKKENINQSLLK